MHAHTYVFRRQQSATFARVSEPLQRHILLANDLAQMPWHFRLDDTRLTMAHDPVPPADGIDGYPRAPLPTGDDALAPDDSFLAALLRSLDVNYDPVRLCARGCAL